MRKFDRDEYENVEFEPREHSAVQNVLGLIREIEDPRTKIEVAQAMLDEIHMELAGLPVEDLQQYMK